MSTRGSWRKNIPLGDISGKRRQPACGLYIIEVMYQLPPHYYRKPNSLPRSILSVAAVLVMFGLVPLGVYLVGQNTYFAPEASAPLSPATGEESFTFERMSTSSAQEVVVNILARSDRAPANLFASKIFFPAQKLALVRLATGSSQVKADSAKMIEARWVDTTVNNQTGEVSLIGGVPNPGLQTEPGSLYVLAQATFRIKAAGFAVLHFDPDSAIYFNQDNQQAAVRKNDLTLELAAPPLPASLPKSSSPPAPVAKNQPTLSLISPSGAETIPFSLPSQVVWKAGKLQSVSVSLLLNDRLLGRIATAAAAQGYISWTPSDYILPTFLSSANSFKIEIAGQGARGETVTTRSSGPFAIVDRSLGSVPASQSAVLAAQGGDANHDGVINLKDLSVLFSLYGRTDNLDLGADLNADGAVNDVDLYLFRKVILKNI